MRFVCGVLMVPVVMLLSSSPAQAAVFTFNVDITNAQEVPPVSPTTAAGAPRVSFGTATFVLNDAIPVLTFTATVTGIDFGGQSTDPNDNLTAAHIHARGDAGPTAPVVWGFFGLPFNDTMPPSPDTVFTPFATGVGFTVTSKWDALEGQNTTLQAQIANILAGRAYINFHTTQFGGGEIRGNIRQVPEPTTLALLGLGLAGLTRRLRNRN